MFKTISAIRDFGLLNYLAKKAYKVSPSLYRKYAVGGGRFHPTAYGVQMHENWDDATFRMCVFGGHGTGLSTILAGMKTPFIFVDIGANQGLFSLLAAQNQNCLSVIAFEPVPDTFGLLHANILNAGLQDKAILEMSAISMESGTTKIEMQPKHSGGATISGRSLDGASSIQIKTICAKELAQILPLTNDILITHEPQPA